VLDFGFKLGPIYSWPYAYSVKKVFLGKPDGRRRRGRPRKRWLDDLEEDLRNPGVKGWRRKAEDREEWRHVVKKAEVLYGL
jgi:hypothetical protein